MLFRQFPKYGITNLNAIVVNYFTCFSCGVIATRSPIIHTELASESWFYYALFLSFTFIVFFNVNAYTIQKVGMVITSIFQKLSLIGPFLAGLLLFGEPATTTKYIAIVITILSIILINIPEKNMGSTAESMKKYWYWPLLVFFGSGLIETTLFYAQETGAVKSAGLEFVSILFFLSGCWE